MEEQGRRGARLYDAFLAEFLDIIQIGADEARSGFLGGVELAPGARLLDVGIGTGGNFAYLLSMNRELDLYGIDISIEMLQRCQRKLSKLRKTIDLVVGFAEHIPFRTGTFDVVMHAGAINEFRDPAAALLETTRVAAPGAQIVVADEWLTAENIDTDIGRRLLKAFPSLPTRSSPPESSVPQGVTDVKVQSIWNGFGFRLNFRKPCDTSDTTA